MWLAFPSSGCLDVPPFVPWSLLHFITTMRTSDFPRTIGLPSGLPVVPPYPRIGGIHGISRVPNSALMTCHGLRPRWTLGSHGDGLLRCGLPLFQRRRHPRLLFITGLNPFTLTHCGPSFPCVRFTDDVTGVSATLGTRALPGLTGLGLSPS